MPAEEDMEVRSAIERLPPSIAADTGIDGSALS
jgi:hypothetical protein